MSIECFVCEKLLELSTLWKTIAKLSAGYTLLFTANFPVGLTRAQRTAVVKLLHDTGRFTVGASVAADTRRVGAGPVGTQAVAVLLTGRDKIGATDTNAWQAETRSGATI